MFIEMSGMIADACDGEGLCVLDHVVIFFQGGVGKRPETWCLGAFGVVWGLRSAPVARVDAAVGARKGRGGLVDNTRGRCGAEDVAVP